MVICVREFFVIFLRIPELTNRNQPCRNLSAVLLIFFLVGIVLSKSIKNAFAQNPETVIATLVDTTDTFRFTPPSSDPAGITYLPNQNIKT